MCCLMWHGLNETIYVDVWDESRDSPELQMLNTRGISHRLLLLFITVGGHETPHCWSPSKRLELKMSRSTTTFIQRTCRFNQNTFKCLCASQYFGWESSFVIDLSISKCNVQVYCEVQVNSEKKILSTIVSLIFRNCSSWWIINWVGADKT